MTGIVNLAYVILIDDDKKDGTVTVLLDSSKVPSLTMPETTVKASELSVYGEGEMLVTRWLREIAGQATEGSDGSLEN